MNGYVLVKPREEKKISGIEIPASVDKEKISTGTVKIQTTYENKEAGHTITLSVGATVLFDSLRPKKVEHDGEECLLIPASDIYAVIEE